MKQTSPASPALLRESIAWLSVIILAAGWSPTIRPEWQIIWVLFGLLGLVSAVGLSYVPDGDHARPFVPSRSAGDAALSKSLP